MLTKQTQLSTIAMSLYGISQAITVSADSQFTPRSYIFDGKPMKAKFPLMIDHPTGADTLTLAHAVIGLGSDSDLYKSLVQAVPEVSKAEVLKKLIDDVQSNKADDKQRQIAVNIINWYNSLGGEPILTIKGDVYTVHNLHTPTNTLMVVMTNKGKETNQKASRSLHELVPSTKSIGKLMDAFEKLDKGSTHGYVKAFESYAEKVTKQGSDIAQLSTNEAVEPVLSALQDMMSRGSTALRNESVKGTDATEATFAIFYRPVITGQLSGRITQKTTRFMDTEGNSIKEDVHQEVFAERAKIDGYKLVEARTQHNIKTYYYKSTSDRKIKIAKSNDNKPPRVGNTYYVDIQGVSLKDPLKGSAVPDTKLGTLSGYFLYKAHTITSSDLEHTFKGSIFGEGDILNIYVKGERLNPDTTTLIDELVEKADEETEELITPVPYESDGVESTSHTTEPAEEVKDATSTEVNATTTESKEQATESVKKVAKFTRWVDEHGKLLKDDMDGEHPDDEGDDFNGYQLLHTETNKDMVMNTYKMKDTAFITHYTDEKGVRLLDDVVNDKVFAKEKSIKDYLLKQTRISQSGREKFYVYKKGKNDTGEVAGTTKKVKKNKQEDLPDTGDRSASKGLLVGGLLTALGSGGFFYWKKKSDQDHSKK